MKYYLFFISFMLLNLTNAQVPTKSIEFGGWIGGANSFNDLNTTTSFKTTRPGAGAIVKYNFNNRISLDANLSFATTFSSDEHLGVTEFHKQRNEAAKTKTADFQLAGEFNFQPLGSKTTFNTHQFTPYLSSGIGISMLKTHVFSREARDFVDVGTILEDGGELKSPQINIPLAAGFKWLVQDNLTVATEFNSKILFSDYYDSISTVYNQATIDNSAGTIILPSRQRGDRSRNDAYNFFGVQVTYVIRPSYCPGAK